MFETKPGQPKQEPEDMFADTVPVAPPPVAGASAPASSEPQDIPELTGPVFSPGKLWTTIGIIVVVLALAGAGVWWFWWRPKQRAATIVQPNEPVPQSTQNITPPPPPLVTDTDGDGLPDTEEAQFGTNPALADTDGDGLLDGEEARTWKTNPLKADTDGDGYTDKQEIDNGYNPNGPGKLVNEKEDIKKLGN